MVAQANLSADSSSSASKLLSSQRRIQSFSSSNRDIRRFNIESAKNVAETLRTCLGNAGKDKLVYSDKNNALITNDGATIMKKMKLNHPSARMLKELAEAQDKQVGDGTTTAVVLAGAILSNCSGLLDRDFHPSHIIDTLYTIKDICLQHIDDISNHIDLDKVDMIQHVAEISLNSKVVGAYSSVLAPLAVQAVKLVEASCRNGRSAQPNDIKLITKLGGGVIEDSKIIDGLIFESAEQPSCKFGKVNQVKNAKIALVQFHISSPKPYTESTVVVSDPEQMKQISEDERCHIQNIVSHLKDAGVTLLLIQKSILRDSMSKIGKSMLNDAGIMFVDNIDRKDINLIAKRLGVKPIVTLDHVKSEYLASAELANKVKYGEETVVEVTGIKKPLGTGNSIQDAAMLYEADVHPVNIILTASNKILLDELNRSMFDAISAVICTTKQSKLVAGGGAVETSVAIKLKDIASDLSTSDLHIYNAVAKGLEEIPSILCENLGISQVLTLMELEKIQREKGPQYGISGKTNGVNNMTEENVLQPSMVTKSAISLVIECVCSILKVDDIIISR